MQESSVINQEAVQRATREFILENFLFGEAREFEPEESFLETGLIDSTGILELVQYLEEAYGITVEDEEMVPENLDSLKNVAQFILYKTTGSRQ